MSKKHDVKDVKPVVHTCEKRTVYLLSRRQILGTGNFPKTLPRFVLILMERQRNQAFCVTATDWSHDHDLMNINLSYKLDNLYVKLPSIPQ